MNTEDTENTEETGCIIPMLVFFILGLIPTVAFFISFKTKSIWRGPGFEPTINLSNNPVSYYVFIVMFLLLSIVFYGGFIWLLVLRIRQGK